MACAGSDGLSGFLGSTVPMDRSAESIGRRNRPNTAFKLRCRSDMQTLPSITRVARTGRIILLERKWATKYSPRDRP